MDSRFLSSPGRTSGAGFFRACMMAVVTCCLALTAVAQSFTYVGAFTGLGQPTGLSIDTIGGVSYLYVSDHGAGRVFKFNLATGERTQIGSYGAGDGQFIAPDAIAIEPVTHDLYIPDRTLHRITRITNTGTFVMKFGGNGPDTNRFGQPGAGTAAGQFNGPQGAVIDAAGHLYVTEHENHRVQKFRVSQSGSTWNVEPLAMWGSGGSGVGQFNTPYGITADAAGNIWVADGFNSRLQKFTPGGTYISQLIVRGPTEAHLVNTWVTFDQAGDLYVSITSDPNTGGLIANQRIEKFTATGTSLGKWGTYGSEPGNFKLPFGFAIDRATNRAYVADWDNGRVQIFDLGPGGSTTAPTGPASRIASVGSSTSLTTTAAAGSTYQWRFNGSAIAGATAATHTVTNVQPAHAGLYTTLVANGSTSALTSPALLGVAATAKVTGSGSEVGANIVHANGNTYDQVLLQGTSASVTADANQVVRISYVDLQDDIVQVEFSGAGTLTITLDAASGPAAPAKYTQPGVNYMKGHANIVISGANESTHVSVFSVGRANAVNQSLFRSDVTYDGWADIGSISIISANGRFGGLRAGNTGFTSSQGHTGVFAPNVEFTGPVIMGDIHASNDATPIILLGATIDTMIAGGNLQQFNNRAVQVSGFSQLRFVGGSDSHGNARPAQTNQGVLEHNGSNVTSQVVVNPK